MNGRRDTSLLSERVYRALLVLYPRPFRSDFGNEMARSFRSLCEEELRRYGRTGLFKLWLYTLLELLTTAVKERWRSSMDTTRLTRLGGSIAAVGGGLLVVYGGLMPLYDRLYMSIGSASPALFDGLQIVAQAGTLLLVGGLLGIFCRVASAGRLGLARVAVLGGLVAAVVAGLSLSVGSVLMLVSGAPEVGSDSVPDVLMPVLSLVGIWTLSISTGLLGLSVWRTGTLGKWSVLPVSIGAVMLGLLVLATVATLAYGPRTLQISDALETFIYIGAPSIVLGLAWVLLGYVIRSENSAGSRSPLPTRS